MRRWWTSLAMAALLAAPAAAKEKQDPRVTWLAEHALKVASIDPAQEDFSDLQLLKKTFAGARLVMLGEASHGDGACFHAKTRLIKFLHKEMDFDVLAFESGLFDCRRAWLAYGQGEDAYTAARAGIFGIWTMSHEVRPLIDYLGAAAKTKRPLELCGFDCQLTASGSREYLADALADALRKYAPEAMNGKDWKAVKAAIPLLLEWEARFEGRAGARAIQAFDALAEAVAQDADEKDRERQFWAQLLRSLKQQTAVHLQRQEGKVKGARANNLRDAMMAENLIWLVDRYYAGRKVIVWAATSHIMHNPDKLKSTAGSNALEGYAPMGHAVWQHFGDESYVLGFTAYGGQKGYPTTGKVFPIQSAPKGSFDDLCRRAGLENAIVDLRRPPAEGAWLQEAFLTRPLGYGDMRGPWHQVVDGLFFQRTMTPSTRSGHTPAGAAPDLGPLVEKRWTEIRAGLERGNMWANKWTLDETFEKWRQSETPDEEAIRAQEAHVSAFLETHGKNAEAAWRAHALLATMAQARGDGKAAAEQLDLAITRFPEGDIPRAEMTSQFQHLVRKRAFLLWDEKGERAACKLALDRLATDRRMRFLYLPDWEERLGKGAVDFRKALKRTYKKRRKLFANLKAEIDRFLAQLD